MVPLACVIEQNFRMIHASARGVPLSNYFTPAIVTGSILGISPLPSYGVRS